MTRLILFILLSSGIAAACRDTAMMPRPRAYPRVEYPDRGAYRANDQPGCPFAYEYPGYMEIRAAGEPCWFDLYMPAFDARLHCSYIEIKDREAFDDLVRDVFVIAGTINARANYMSESRIVSDHEVGGLCLTWTGAAASPVHFFLTDTTTHFFRGALYFNAKVQPDSLAPISTFIKADIDRIISSFRWR